MPFNEDLNRMVNDASDYTFRYEPEDIEQHKWICALSYLSILFFLPLVVCPKSRFGKFHANQALILFLVTVVGNVLLSIVKSILGIVHLAWLGSLASGAWSILMVVLMIMGIVYAIQGKAKELPGIGKIHLIKE